MTSLSEVPAGKIPDATALSIPHLLRFSAASDNKGKVNFFYFVAAGERVTTARTTLTLIAKTSSKREQALVFPSEAAAITAWDLSGRPDGWITEPA